MLLNQTSHSFVNPVKIYHPTSSLYNANTCKYKVTNLFVKTKVVTIREGFQKQNPGKAEDVLDQGNRWLKLLLEQNVQK